ncbi:MAG: restriction endonuclease subunit S, partial [Lachnospiraceae bacterium]|nr:restriction endonuclease subunit S [Lachnospiraceae bacterium]
GARSDRFSIKNDLFFMMPIPVPTEEEQRRIGSLLSTLDKTITLHQRKCNCSVHSYLCTLFILSDLHKKSKSFRCIVMFFLYFYQ